MENSQARAERKQVPRGPARAFPSPLNSRTSGVARQRHPPARGSGRAAAHPDQDAAAAAQAQAAAARLHRREEHPLRAPRNTRAHGVPEYRAGGVMTGIPLEQARARSSSNALTCIGRSSPAAHTIGSSRGRRAQVVLSLYRPLSAHFIATNAPNGERRDERPGHCRVPALFHQPGRPAPHHLHQHERKHARQGQRPMARRVLR